MAKKTSKKKDRTANMLILSKKDIKKRAKAREKFRPDVFDLKWEIVRRIPQYQEDYKALKNNPALARKRLKTFKDRWTALAFKFDLKVVGGPSKKTLKEAPDPSKKKLNEAPDPSKSWKDFDLPPTWKPPMFRKAKVELSLPDDNPHHPAQFFWFIDDKGANQQGKKKTSTIFDDDYKNRYLWMRINPTSSIKEIKALIGNEVSKYKKNIKRTRTTITDMIKWLHVVDKVEKKNPKPTRKTFALLFGKDDAVIQRRFKDYARGKILIQCFPNIKSISKKQVKTYLRAHDFIIPRST